MSGFGVLVTAIALFYVLFRIPFWLLSATKIGNGRSFLGGLVKAFVAAKTFGLVAGQSGRVSTPQAATAAGMRRGGGRGSAADPPWPAQPRIAPTPDAVSKRLQAAYDADRARAARQPRPPSQRPEFLQPTPQETTHDPAITPATQGPAMPEFSATPQPATPVRPAARPRRQAAVTPQFQAPGAARRKGSGQPAARPVAVAAVPPHLRFQPPTPEPNHVSQPVKPTTAPPAAPVFRPAHPEPRIGDARPRTPSVPPLQFRPPPTPATAMPCSACGQPLAGATCRNPACSGAGPHPASAHRGERS